MELRYFGGNCVKINTKKVSIVIDDNVNITGKPISTDRDIAIYTGKTNDQVAAHFLINGPGEYEVSDVSISGIPSRAHIDEAGTSNNTMYRLLIDDVRIGVIGHSHPEISDDQLEILGTLDILVIPVGGHGYTLDGIAAHKIINEIEPKIVVPTHYDDGKTHTEVPQAPLEEAIKALSMDVSETVEVLKIKNTEALGDTTKIIVIEPKK